MCAFFVNLNVYYNILFIHFTKNFCILVNSESQYLTERSDGDDELPFYD